ncbi:gasdermin-C [Puma concolor]|uniref:Gasdermin-C n=1 Tax=Puma concolor TaxID=9696 RepID=A0A6P6HSP7_PUMCO|nr:gasdermin-C [Puma concolor]
MSSMFENISKNLVKELGDKDLTPVKHLLNANKFRQFAILRKKKKTLSQFWELPDIPVEYTLMDILEPSSSVPETVIKGPFIFSDTMFRKYKASAGVTAMLETNVSGEATKCHETFLQFHAITFPPQNWKDLLKRKVLDQELLFLRKCRGRDDNLYVVTEAVELINSTVLHDSSSVNVLGKCFIPWMTSVKGQGQGEGLKVREKMLTLPEGTVIAYKKKQLIFENNGWDFKQLHEEIFQEMEALAQLSKDTQDSIFHTILNKLGNREALQDLTDTLDGSPLDLLDDFGGTILNEMQPDTRDLWIQARFHIIYLLEAIMVLSDTQHDLLAQSMEKRILLQQQKLVRSILEPNFKYCWDIPFTLKPELLAPLQGEDLAITYGLLEECGLKMELNSPRSTWHLETKQPLSALYGTLSLLKQLAGSPERPGPTPVYAESVPDELRGENSCMGLNLEAWTARHCPWYSQPGPQWAVSASPKTHALVRSVAALLTNLQCSQAYLIQLMAFTKVPTAVYDTCLFTPPETYRPCLQGTLRVWSENWPGELLYFSNHPQVTLNKQSPGLGRHTRGETLPSPTASRTLPLRALAGN